MFERMDATEKEHLLKERFPGKIRYAGPKSPQVKKVLDVTRNRKGNTDRHIAVEGLWANGFILKYQVDVRFLMISLDAVVTPEAADVLMSLSARAECVYLVSAKTFSGITESGNAAGILSVCTFPYTAPEALPWKTGRLAVVLDGLEIPGNVGTIVRSADGTDADMVCICNRKTRLTHPKFIRSSQGACFKLPIAEFETDALIARLLAEGYQIVLADTEGAVPYYAPSYTDKVALVMGSERYGISEAWYRAEHTAVSIPMYGDCDSLNVGIAATLLLYEIALNQKGVLKR